MLDDSGIMKGDQGFRAQVLDAAKQPHQAQSSPPPGARTQVLDAAAQRPHAQSSRSGVRAQVLDAAAQPLPGSVVATTAGRRRARKMVPNQDQPRTMGLPPPSLVGDDQAVLAVQDYADMRADLRDWAALWFDDHLLSEGQL
eukprot:6252567-Pyramimonas_sp.AAC.1